MAKFVIFDDYDTKIKGEFPSRESALTWLAKNAPLALEDPETFDEVFVATSFEADVLLRQHPFWTVRKRQIREFIILEEIENDRVEQTD